MKIESKVEISKPPSEIFEFLMEEENMILWIKNFITLERLEGEEGQAGSISRHVYNENGRTVEFFEEILEVEPGKLFHSILRNPTLEIEITNKLKPIDADRTLLWVETDRRPITFWAKIRHLFSKKKWTKRQAEDLQRFKDAIEELAEDYE